jgi:hypothetical protein
VRELTRATIVLLGSVWACMGVLSAEGQGALKAPPPDGAAVATATNVQQVTLDVSYLKTGQKPAKFESWGDRLDYIHAGMETHLTAQIYDVDSYFAVPGEAPIKPPAAKFRMGIYLELDENGSKFAMDPDFDIEVSLPNMEKRWKVFITREGVGDLPGLQPTERENDLNIGVRSWNERFRIKTDAGVKAKWLPEAFARVTWQPVWNAGGVRFYPYQRFYWESDDGFGELSQLVAQVWLGRKQRHTLRSVSAAKYAEDTYGFHLEQTLIYGYVMSLIDETRRGKTIDKKNARKGIALRYTGFGTTDPLPVIEESGIQRHRFSVVYRRPLYKEWMFLELIPQVEFEREDDWEQNISFRVGFDALFWDVGR